MTRSITALLATMARNIRAQRAKAGLSQERLAEISGLHRTYIGGVERGERNITVLSLERIATALRVPVATLLASSKKHRV